jgi:DHA1 family inner membrane transport protein
MAIAAGFGWTSTGWVGSGLALGGLIVWAISRGMKDQEGNTAGGRDRPRRLANDAS